MAPTSTPPVLDQDPSANPLSLQVLPLQPDGHGSRQYWKREIDAAIERIGKISPEWDNNVLSYRAKALTAIPDNGVGQVVVPRDFPMVEQKSAQLFFQTPETHLKTNLDTIADAVTQWQPVVNHYLGEDEINSLAMMNEVIFDALCPSGLMCSKIGYETFIQGTQQLPTGEMMDDPEYQPTPGIPSPLDGILGAAGMGEGRDPSLLAGNILGLGSPAPAPPQVPVLGAPVPNIVHSRFFWERFSPKALLIPWNFNGSVYDKAQWLGQRFEEDWVVIKKRYNLSDDMEIPKSRSTDRKDLLLPGEKDQGQATTRARDAKVTGQEIWYRCAFYIPGEAHPEKIYQLVLLDGMDTPLVHRLSPYQRMSPSGILIGMMGFPIHIGALRYVSDTAFPPSECSISRATNDELNKGRTQQMLQRDRSIPMRFGNLSKLGGEAGLNKIRENIWQSIIPVTNLDPNSPPLLVASLASYPRENFTFNDYLDRDYEQIWSMGANQRGQETEKSLTATEISKIDQWANTRLDKERRQVLTYFIRGTRKVGQILQMFLTDEQVVAVIGPENLQRLSVWDRKTTPNALAYSANPDSAIRIDQTQARQQILKLYELLAKDPNFRRTELLIEVCRQWNLDPQKFVVTELPQKPAPATISFRFDSEQLDTRNPNFPMYLAILKAQGYDMLEKPVVNEQTGEQEPSPVEQAMLYSRAQAQVGNAVAGSGAGVDAFPPPEPGNGPRDGDHEAYPAEHGGTAPKADRINKHQGDETGDRSGPKPKLANTH